MLGLGLGLGYEPAALLPVARREAGLRDHLLDGAQRLPGREQPVGLQVAVHLAQAVLQRHACQGVSRPLGRGRG